MPKISNSILLFVPSRVIDHATTIMAKFMKHATAEMFQNNQTEINCSCQRCKMKNLIKYDSGHLEAHILRRGFMDGYIPYPKSDEDQERAEGNEEGHHHDNNNDGGEEDEEFPDMVINIKMAEEIITKIFIKMWEETMI